MTVTESASDRALDGCGFEVFTMTGGPAATRHDDGGDPASSIVCETWFCRTEPRDRADGIGSGTFAGPAWSRAVAERTRRALRLASPDADADADADVEVMVTRLLVRARPGRPVDVGTDIWSVGAGIGCFAMLTRRGCVGGDLRLWRPDEDFPVWRDALGPGAGVLFDTGVVDFDLSSIEATDADARQQFVLAFARPVPGAAVARPALSNVLARCRFDTTQRR